jgi:protein-disulfide isomerase
VGVVHWFGMKNPWIIIGAITIVLFGGAIWFSSNASEKNNEGVFIQENVKGSEDAKVTLTEFSDLQCPACASFEPALQGVLAEYGDDIRFEYKHFPLPIHPYAQQASVAAEAAGMQGKFFEYHDVLFENQSTWSAAATPAALFIGYAEELELDIAQFRRHMNSSVLREKVQAEMAEGRELGVTGTPTFFLNGERMQIETFQDFATQIAIAVDPEAAAELVNPDADESVVGEQSGETVRFGL